MALLLLFQDDCDYDAPVQDMDTGELAEALTQAREARDAARKSRNELWESEAAMKVAYGAMAMKTIEMKRDLDRVTRNHALVTLERILLERYIDPVDRWFENAHLAKEPIEWTERWYVLIVEPADKVKGAPIWVKFSMTTSDAVFNKHQGIDRPRYYAMKRRGILDNLERVMAENLGDPECIETMREGTAHVYRLPTKDSPVDKVRKEDRVY